MATAGEAIGVVDAPPIEALGDAEPPQRRTQRAAGTEPGKIMRAGVEAVEAGLAEMARLAQEGVAIAAGNDVGLEDRDLQPGVGEQRRRGEPADPGADHRHVDRALALGAAEPRRRPAISRRRSILRRRTARMNACGPKIETSAPKAKSAVVASAPAASAMTAASARNNTPQRPEISMLTSSNSGLSDSAAKAARE